MSYLITSRALLAGSAPKVADQIADTIVDYALSYDPDARIDCKCMWDKNTITIAGNIAALTGHQIPYMSIAQQVLNFVGYGDAGITYNVSMAPYQAELFASVAPDTPIAAGLAVGYATNETPSYLPLGQKLANDISVIMFSEYSGHKIEWMKSDGECQITLRYEDDGEKVVDSLMILAQHRYDYTLKQIVPGITKVCNAALANTKIDPNVKYYINPTGTFINGGSKRSVGMSGTHPASDMYGLYCPIGDSPTGKDPSYVGRFGNYYARYVCKNIVASGACDKMALKLAYIPSLPEPASIAFNCYGTEKVSLAEIDKAINNFFNYKSTNIINQFGLKKKIKYLNYSCFGQMGRLELDSPWEKLDKVDTLKEFFKKEN